MTATSTPAFDVNRQPFHFRRHLLALEGLDADTLFEVLDLAERLADVAAGRAPRLDTLREKTIANLFFEDSTRTRSSFTMAARRLGADTLDITSAGSSVKKGETIVDTALNIQAMGVHALVIRCNVSGGTKLVADHVDIPVINAGDGSHEHPTQGLLDLLTLRQHLKTLNGRTIAIVGDIANSRVARSNIHALTAAGANVILVGPPTLAPKTFEKIADPSAPGTVRVQHDLDDVISGEIDAIMMLRVQFERASGPPLITGDYHQLYGLTRARAARLPAHAIVMHPGPMNRGLEIDSEVADDPERSVIRRQVSNGVAVRMAVLSMLCAPGSRV